MKKFLAPILGLLLLSTPALAQCDSAKKTSGDLPPCCPASGKAKVKQTINDDGAKACPFAKLAAKNKGKKVVKTIKLSDRYQRLLTGAQNGCSKSKAKLAKFQEACGTGCSKSTLARISKLESSAAKGCSKSTTKLASLRTALGGRTVTTRTSATQRTALSARYQKLLKGAEKGCAKSQTKLAALKSACGTGCSKTALKKISTLESKAARGCSSSKAKLASLRASIAGRKGATRTAALSKRFARWQKGAKKGCATSKGKLAAVKSACGTGCSGTAASRIAKLEASAAKGCAKSKAKLATFEASLKQTRRAKKKPSWRTWF